MLSVRNLKRLSIGPVDLDLAPGEIVALVGPSGMGKSLLMRAIADLDPNEGEATLNGQSRASMTAPEWRKQVMYVPAHSGWWADWVEPHFEGAMRSRVIELLQRLGLESTALGWPVANLSTGERQRLSLARALALNPKVLMLDEPTSGLDTDNAERAEALIRRHAAEGSGVLFVTHDAAQASRLGERVLRLKDGQLFDEPVTPQPHEAPS
ncbi:MAG: ABC transporter ATP-binding protein [Rhodospirillales bacterium]|nr:ABC transporter ATP-binding protein [Rhodospirillales bacterium]